VDALLARLSLHVALLVLSAATATLAAAVARWRRFGTLGYATVAPGESPGEPVDVSGNAARATVDMGGGHGGTVDMGGGHSGTVDERTRSHEWLQHDGGGGARSGGAGSGDARFGGGGSVAGAREQARLAQQARLDERVRQIQATKSPPASSAKMPATVPATVPAKRMGRRPTEGNGTETGAALRDKRQRRF
jgi:hypothetical protein